MIDLLALCQTRVKSWDIQGSYLTSWEAKKVAAKMFAQSSQGVRVRQYNDRYVVFSWTKGVLHE